MRRADGLHILSLTLACIGALSAAAAVTVPLLLAAACCTGVGIWCSRSQSRLAASASARRLTQLQAHAGDLETRLLATRLESESARAAIDELTGQVAPIIEAIRPSQGSLGPSIPPEPSVDVDPTSPEALVRRLSHDLRTPLTSIQACSELLLEGEAVDGVTARDLAGIIHTESQRLGLFIDSALTSTRMHEGLLPVRKHALSLDEVAERALHCLLPLATQRQVRLTLERSVGNETVLADQHLLEHVLRILFCDAIHQAACGGPMTIRTAVDADRGMVRLEVCCHYSANDAKPGSSAPDRFYGGGEKVLGHFVPGTVGVDLARRLIETVHGGTTIARRTDDAWVTGFELPVAAPPGGDVAEACAEVNDA